MDEAHSYVIFDKGKNTGELSTYPSRFFISLILTMSLTAESNDDANHAMDK
jgi:hypothetical protein